jgi:hypothetical protein
LLANRRPASATFSIATSLSPAPQPEFIAMFLFYTFVTGKNRLRSFNRIQLTRFALSTQIATRRIDAENVEQRRRQQQC